MRRFVEFLLEHPEVGVVSSDWELIDEAGNCLGVRDHPVKVVTPGLEYIEHTIRSGRSSVGVPGAMIRRAALNGIRFDEQGHLGFGDFVVWFQVAERWQIGHIGQRLWRWRQHRQSQSARTIESLTRDYEENLHTYFAGHLRRWPDHVALVERWQQASKQYLFWALAYEVGLHFRREQQGLSHGRRRRTLFELMEYQLTEEEFRRALQQMHKYCDGIVQSCVLWTIHAMIRTRMTAPLAWTTKYQTMFRYVIGLR